MRTIFIIVHEIKMSTTKKQKIFQMKALTSYVFSDKMVSDSRIVTGKAGKT